MRESELKRFVISKETYSQERVHATQEAVLELQEKHPEILGLGLFGSLTKGKSREDSDIDGYLFVNASLVENEAPNKGPVVEYKRELKRGTATEEALGIKRLSVYPHFKKTIDEYYEKMIRDAIKEKLNSLSDEQTEHLRVFPMSEQIINVLLEEFATNQNQRTAFIEELASYKDEINTLDDIKRVASKTKNKLPELIPNVSLFFNAMFFLRIGNGVKPYRKMLLDKLSGMGSLGENIWEGIMSAQEEFERAKESGKSEGSQEVKRYPKTLKEGMAVYG